MVLLALALQSAAPAPDISIHAIVDARNVTVERRGQTSIRAVAEPEGGSRVRSSGNSGSRHFELSVDARIANALRTSPESSEPETPSPQPR